MTSRTAIVVAAVAAVAIVLGTLALRSGERNHEAAAPLEAHTVSTPAGMDPATVNNPLLADLRAYGEEALRSALRCVARSGLVECGELEGRSALYLAALLGAHDELLKLSTAQNLQRDGDLAIGAAVAIDDPVAVELMIEQGRRLGVLATDYRELGPFFGPGEPARADDHPAVLAASIGQLSTLSYFVEHGFDVNAPLQDGKADLLVETLMSGNEDVVRYILEQGFEIDCSYATPRGVTYLGMARMNGLDSAFQVISQRCLPALQTSGDEPLEPS